MNTIVPIHSNLTLKHPMTKHIYDPEPETPAAGKPNVPKIPKSNENKRLNGFSSCIIYNKYLMILYLLFWLYIYVCLCVCLLISTRLSTIFTSILFNGF